MKDKSFESNCIVPFDNLKKNKTAHGSSSWVQRLGEYLRITYAFTVCSFGTTDSFVLVISFIDEEVAL